MWLFTEAGKLVGRTGLGVGVWSLVFGDRCRLTCRHTNGNVTKAVVYQNLEFIGEKSTLDFGVISIWIVF